MSSGLADEAYARYGITANRAGTYVAWYRAVITKYPHKKPADVLADLVAETPGDEGKWFAAAKDAGLFDEAIALANRTPCSPQTLTRAARDFVERQPAFALEAGMAALRWLVEGYGYDVTALLVGYGAQAPRALVYTVGFVGGLFGTVIALNRHEPRLWEAIILGAAFGVVGGYLAAYAIEALYRGVPFESAWNWHFKKGRVPATNYALMYGLIGGVASCVLSTALHIFKSWVRQQRAEADREAQTIA